MSKNKIINKQDLLNNLSTEFKDIETNNLLTYNNKQCFKKTDLDKSFFYSTYVKNQNKILSERDFFPISREPIYLMYPNISFDFKVNYATNTKEKQINLSIDNNLNKNNVFKIMINKTKENVNIFYLFTKGSIEDDNLIQKLYGIKLNYKETTEDNEGNIYYHYTLSGVTESGVTEYEITDDLEFYGYDDYNSLIKIYPEYPLEITNSPLLEYIDKEIVFYDAYELNLKDLLEEWSENNIMAIHEKDNLEDYTLKIGYKYPLNYEAPFYDYDRLNFNKYTLLYNIDDGDKNFWQKGGYDFPDKTMLIDNNLNGAFLYIIIDQYVIDNIEQSDAIKFVCNGYENVNKINYYRFIIESFSQEVIDGTLLNDVSSVLYTYCLLIEENDITINNNVINFISNDVTLYEYSNTITPYPYTPNEKMMFFRGFKESYSSLNIKVYEPEWFIPNDTPYCTLELTVHEEELRRGFNTNNLILEFNNFKYDNDSWYHKRYIFQEEESEIQTIKITNIPLHIFPKDDFHIRLKNVDIQNEASFIENFEIDFSGLTEYIGEYVE